MPVNSEAKVNGVWVSTVSNLDFPSSQGLTQDKLKTELDSIVSTCKKLGVNTVFFQVRPASDAFYKSDIFPWSKYLSGMQGTSADGNFDPLEYLLGLCKKQEISLHAWINPYRVCKADELDTLSPDNPAVIHPEYTVSCSDGNVYYNPALSEVRDLVTDGVREILEKYDVDGIHFDDYFYPYGVTDYPDSADYEKYGKKFKTVADFRRNNVNLLVKQVSKAVSREGKQFGISPFGIWDNKRDNPKGSDTAGMSSYSEIFADSRYWVKNGLVDYICPQVYWSFENNAAPFDVITKWWAKLCKQYKVDLYIGHGLYKLGCEEDGWQSAYQVKRQLDFCNSYPAVKGNVFFRYKTLCDNILGCADVLTGNALSFEVPETVVQKTDTLRITTPANNKKTTSSNISISGVCDPNARLFVNGEAVSVTKSGFFSVYKSLSTGKNVFTFTSGEQTRSVTVIRENSDVKTPDCFYSNSSYPSGECIFSPSQTVTVEVDALVGIEVHAVCGGNDIVLTESPVSEKRARYTADIIMPQTVFDDAHYGTVSFYGIVDGVRYDHSETANITVSNKMQKMYTLNDCYVYNSAFDGSMMDNYQLSAGSVVYVTAFANDSYRLLSGKWVAKEHLTRDYVESSPDISKKKYDKITVESDTVFESYALVNESGTLLLSLYGTENLKIKGKEHRHVEHANYSTVTINGVTGFYCDRVSDNKLEVYIYRMTDSLKGKTIAIDAGHGGSDCGALGPGGDAYPTEAQLNLSMALMLANKLSQLGADVYLTRTDDSSLLLDKRAGMIRKNHPDMSISVHHNSVAESSDFNAQSGALVLYSRETALPLAESLASSLGGKTVKQSLNVCRDYRFPCVLVECGFVCNPNEYEILLTYEYKNDVCEKISATISDYFSKNS